MILHAEPDARSEGPRLARRAQLLWDFPHADLAARNKGRVAPGGGGRREETGQEINANFHRFASPIHRPSCQQLASLLAELLFAAKVQARVFVAGTFVDDVMNGRMPMRQILAPFEENPAGEIVRPAVGVVHIVATG